MGLLDSIRAILLGPRPLPMAAGHLSDLASYCDRLLRSPGDAGTLVVQVVGSATFIQFTGGAQGIEMDFPLITPDQKAAEPKIRGFCDRHDLHVRVSFGTDGSSFLDVDLSADVQTATATVRAAFAEIYGIRDAAPVEFLSQGLAAPR